VRALALANQKGGVGKTTTAIHLGHALALSGLRVAIFDLDPQGNATLALQQAIEQGTSDDAPAPLVSAGDGLWILPSAGAERAIAPSEELDVEGLEALRASLEASVDVLLVDCPPRMDSWGWAGLRLCEMVLVPVQAEFFAMHGLTRMIDTLDLAREETHARSELLGVFVTMFDHREQIAVDVRADLQRNLGSMLLDTVVVRDPQFIEAASHGVSLFDYNPLAKGVRCYASLARELRLRWADVSRETSERRVIQHG